jgi:hypothetical protein
MGDSRRHGWRRCLPRTLPLQAILSVVLPQADHLKLGGKSERWPHTYNPQISSGKLTKNLGVKISQAVEKLHCWHGIQLRCEFARIEDANIGTGAGSPRPSEETSQDNGSMSSSGRPKNQNEDLNLIHFSCAILLMFRTHIGKLRAVTV